jgi:hypothetical protein
VRDAAARILIWTGVAACVAGFFLHRMWTWLPAARFGESLALAGLVALLAWPLRRWRAWAWADALAAVWLVASVWMGGVVPALAVAAMTAGSMALGSFVAARDRPGIALLAGFAMLAGGVGWLLPLPVHWPWVYLPVFVLLVAMRRDDLRAYASAIHEGWREAVDASPRAAAWSTLALGLAAAASWLPTMQFDDLAYHLGLPWQLMLHGRYALDPTHQVWALAPWAGDVLQAIAQLVARAEARGPMNLVWLMAASAALWRLGLQSGLTPTMRWAAVALFASLPTLAALLGGMQTELPATAVTLGLAVLVFAPAAGRRELFAGALLLGLLCALKPMHVLAAVGLILVAGWRWRSALLHVPAWLTLAWAALLAIGIGASSYAYSTCVSGNPVLPLFNAVFQSPYFTSRNFDDARWHGGFDADLPWDLTFHTAGYVEGWNGGIGFVLIALAGAWLAALSLRQTRTLALAAAIALLVPLAVLQYARYAFVGIVLLLPAMLAALQHFLASRQAVAVVATLAVANLAYQTNAEGMLHTGAIKRAILALGRDAPLLERYTPERIFAAHIRSNSPDAIVLDLSGAAYAEFAGRGRTAAWYAPRLEAARAAAEADPSGRRWAALLHEQRVSDVLLRPAQLTLAQRAGLALSGAHLRMTVDEAQWWHVPEAAAR